MRIKYGAQLFSSTALKQTVAPPALALPAGWKDLLRLRMKSRKYFQLAAIVLSTTCFSHSRFILGGFVYIITGNAFFIIQFRD